jgi:hypothetical protein
LYDCQDALTGGQGLTHQIAQKHIPGDQDINPCAVDVPEMLEEMHRQVDERGRLNLGKRFAKQTFIVRAYKDGSAMMLIPAEVIPKEEIWLYQNPKALFLLMEGMQQAAEGKLVDAPDFKADMPDIDDDDCDDEE